MRRLAEYEQKERGTVHFPMDYNYVDMLHPRYKMPFHWHMECEFITVLQGKITLLLDGEVTELVPGLAAFVPSGVIHGGFPQGEDTIYECIVLEMDRFLYDSPVVREGFRDLLGGGAGIRRSFSQDSLAGQSIQQLFLETRTREFGYGFFTTALLWQFVGAVLREHLYTSTESTQHSVQRVQQIKNVLRRIRQDYQSHLTLADLSSEAAMSAKYFCRVFRQITGYTPIDYLNYYRVERAAEQIYATDASITDIALQCGFNELSYFSRMFRKYKGLSPQAYRRSALQRTEDNLSVHAEI